LSRVLVTLLCVFLVATSRQGLAYPNLSLGAGYTSDCETSYTVRADGSLDHTCREGPRAEALIDLFGGEGSTPGKPGKVRASTSSPKKSGSGGSVNWLDAIDLKGGGVGGEILAIIIIIALIVLVTYGLIMGIAAFFSSEKSVGFYYAEDYFPKAMTNADGEGLPGSLRRWGAQVSFFPSENFSFRMHMGAGPASFLPRTDNEDSNYRDGFSSKIGLGFAPHPGESGFYLTGEAEYLTIYARTFKDLLNNALPTKEPEYRATTTGMLGYTFAF